MKLTRDGQDTGLTARFVDPNTFFADWIHEMKGVHVSNPGSPDWRFQATHPRFGRLIAKWMPDTMKGGVGSLIVMATQY